MPHEPPSENERALDWWVRVQNSAVQLSDEEYETMAQGIPEDQHGQIVDEYRKVRTEGVAPVAGEPLFVLHQEVTLRENENARERLLEQATQLREMAETLEQTANKLGKTFTVREVYDKGKLQRSKLTGILRVLGGESE